MKIETIPFSRIQFQKTTYDPILKESLLRMGQGFPIYVKSNDTMIYCIDGHKRLSAIADILKEQPNHKLKQVHVLFLNHARSASTSAKNHH